MACCAARRHAAARALSLLWRRGRPLSRAQAKSKSAQLLQDVAAAQSDRDELQKKYEAKSRCAASVHAPRPPALVP